MVPLTAVVSGKMERNGIKFVTLMALRKVGNRRSFTGFRFELKVLILWKWGMPVAVRGAGNRRSPPVAVRGAEFCLGGLNVRLLGSTERKCQVGIWGLQSHCP